MLWPCSAILMYDLTFLRTNVVTYLLNVDSINPTVNNVFFHLSELDEDDDSAYQYVVEVSSELIDSLPNLQMKVTNVDVNGTDKFHEHLVPWFLQ